MIAYILGQLLSSMAALAFEIILTRIFSLSQWYHFAFMAISVALLGYGLSGTLLTVSPLCRRLPLPWLAGGQAVAMLAGYLVANHIPFDAYRIAWEPVQVLYLTMYYLSLSVPFVFAGLISARLLSRSDLPTGPIYGANLLGSGLGCPLSLALLPTLAGEGSPIATSALAALSAMAFVLAERTGATRRTIALFGFALLTGLLGYLAVNPPAYWAIRLSPYKGLSQAQLRTGAELVYQRWNAFSRVDVVRASGIRSAPGMSLSYGKALPGQWGLFVDGDNLSPIQSPADADSLAFLDYVPEAVLFRLRPRARMLIIEPAAGQPILAARLAGAEHIVVTVSNPLIVDAVNALVPEADNPFQGANVRVIFAGGRSVMAQEAGGLYDIVQLPLTDEYRPLRSGAFSLSENYQLTVEAIHGYLQQLAPGGLLALTRWFQVPPAESLRAGALVVEALSALGVDDPTHYVIVIRSWSTCLILVRREPFSAEEIETIRQFCHQRQFDLVAYPGITPAEMNVYNQLAEPEHDQIWQELLTTKNRREFYRRYPFDITPPTDDRPFFYHFFKWAQTPEILRTLGMTWQPFGGSGYFVLVALLALTLIVGIALIVLPLMVTSGLGSLAGLRIRTLLTFALLGLAFMAVEIPLLQQFILFLDQPTYAFAAVLFALMVFSGIGSLLSARMPARLVATGAAGMTLILAWGAPALIHAMLGSPTWLRAGITVLGLAPAGLLMGLPFPRALSAWRQKAAGAIPWAWAINGVASVVGSVLATMMALSWGFRAVLLAGSLAYVGVALAAWPILREARPK